MGVRSISSVPGKLNSVALFSDLIAIPAAGNQGVVYVVSELNNAQFLSDGTRWRPYGGQQLIAIKGDIVNPVVTLTMTNFADGTQNVVDTTMALPTSLTNYYDSFGWSIVMEPTVLRSGVGSGGVTLSHTIVMADTLAACQGSTMASTAFQMPPMSINASVDSGAVAAQLLMFQGGTRKLSFQPYSLPSGGTSIAKVAIGSYVPTTQQKFFLCCRTASGVVSGDAVALQRLKLYLRA